MRRLGRLALLAGAVSGVACGGAPKKDAGLTVAMMPKNKGNPYFVSCRKGAEEAAKELGVKLLWDGPSRARSWRPGSPAGST